MSLALNDTYITAAITLKSKADGSTTTVNVSNRQCSDVGTFYFPILQEINGLTSAMGEYLPTQIRGTVTLDNSPESFGAERKFSDLLERYSVTEQPIIIYSAFTPTSTAISSYKNQDFKGTITSVSCDPKRGSLVLYISGAPIPLHDVAYQWEFDGYDSVLKPSINGLYLPLVFGSAQTVTPQCLIESEYDDGFPAIFLTASTFKDTFVNGTVESYWAKDHSGEYVEVNSNPFTVSTAVYDKTDAAWTTLFPADIEYGFILNGPYNFIMTGARALFDGTGNAGWTAGTGTKFAYRFYECDVLTKTPIKQIAYAERLKSDVQASIRGAPDFYVDMAFDVATPLNPYKTYAFSVHQTSDATANGGAGDTVNMQLCNAISGELVYRNTDTNGDTWTYVASEKVQEMQLFGAKMTAQPTGWNDTTGLGFDSFLVTQETSLAGTVCDLAKIEFVIKQNGLKDDGSGTLTGVAGTQLDSPLHQIKLLERTWNGSSWVAGVFDFTSLTGTHSPINGTTHRYSRTTAGYTLGRTTADEAIALICRSGAARIAPLNSTTSGKYLGVYGWGNNLTPSFTISGEDGRIQSWEIRDTRTVVNNIRARYARSLLNVNTELERSQGFGANYEKLVQLYNGSNPLGTYYFSASETVYGSRSLGDTSLDMLADETSAEHWTEYIAARYGFAHVYADVIVPLQNYRTVSMLDVGTIVHPDLPAYFGTTAQELPRMAHYEGAEADPLLGFPLSRAEPYECQVEAREIQYNFKGVQELKLTVRILNNSPRDPT